MWTSEDCGLRVSSVPLVDAPDSCGEYLHDLQREGGMFLHEEHELPLIDASEDGWSARNGACTARTRVDQRELADDSATLDRRDDRLAENDVDRSLDDREHHISWIAFLEGDLAGLQAHGIRRVFEDVDSCHARSLARASGGARKDWPRVISASSTVHRCATSAKSPA